jgi:hypothetical protein
MAQQLVADAQVISTSKLLVVPVTLGEATTAHETPSQRSINVPPS